MRDLLVIIPAKGNSSRLKKKNLQKIGNYSLVEKKIKDCLISKIPNQNILLSSDSEKILQYQKKYNLYPLIKRNKKYTRNNSSTFSVVLESIRNYKRLNKIKYIAVLPVTNPLLSYKKIYSAYFKLKKNKKINSIISIVEPGSHPFQFVKHNQKKNSLKFNYFKINGKTYSDYERTQDWPRVFAVSPALKISRKNFFLKYLNNTDHLFNKKVFDIRKCTSILIDNIESIDINNVHDLKIARILNEKKN